MKWFIFIIILIIVVGFILLNQQQINKEVVLPTPIPTINLEPTTLDKMSEVEYQSDHLRYSFYKINIPQQLHLYPNYQTQTNSVDLNSEHNCRLLINGGFYNKENQPLGWVVSENAEIAKIRTNSLFNGFIFSKNGQITIDTKPKEMVDWGLQSGPLLYEAGQPVVLTISNDKLARRMVALLDKENILTFIAITNSQSLTSGLLLTDLPKIVATIAEKENINIKSAINLDGGLASAFITNDLQIKEYQPIGSFFCLEN